MMREINHAHQPDDERRLRTRTSHHKTETNQWMMHCGRSGIASDELVCSATRSVGQERAEAAQHGQASTGARLTFHDHRTFRFRGTVKMSESECSLSGVKVSLDWDALGRARERPVQQGEDERWPGCERNPCRTSRNTDSANPHAPWRTCMNHDQRNCIEEAEVRRNERLTLG